MFLVVGLEAISYSSIDSFYSYFGGSITAFPMIETINSDITEYIATNVISITDGQFYTNKRLFLDSCRPAIDSGI